MGCQPPRSHTESASVAVICYRTKSLESRYLSGLKHDGRGEIAISRVWLLRSLIGLESSGGESLPVSSV